MIDDDRNIVDALENLYFVLDNIDSKLDRNNQLLDALLDEARSINSELSTISFDTM